MLAGIAHDLGGGPPPRTAVPPSAWWQYAVDDDVMIWVRGDVSLWRMKQIRAAVDDMTSRLREAESGGNTRRNRQWACPLRTGKCVAPPDGRRQPAPGR